MSYSYTLANKIRTNLLLFIDREIRTKISNKNKIQNYYNNNLQTVNEEYIYSNNQKNPLNNHPQIPKINIIKVDSQVKTPCIEKYCSQAIEKTLPKLSLQKQPKPIHSSFENIYVELGNKKYKRKNEHKLSSAMIYLKDASYKKSSKIYLTDLCNSLISKTVLRKNVSTKKAQIIKKKKVTKPIKKQKKIYKMSENNCNKNILRQSSSSIDSIKLIVFGY